MTRGINVPITLRAFDGEIKEAFIADLRDRRAGRKPDDRQWHDRQIERAEAGNPDRKELGLFIAFRAGFGSADGYVASGFEIH